MDNILKTIDKKKLGFSFVCTFIFWAIAHGYRFMNNLYTADTLTYVFQDDIYWERSLGRFMHPLPLVLRGTISAPWLVGMLAVAVYAMAIYLIWDIFEINKPYFMVLICGVLICNQTLTITGICFLPWIDVYGVALLLAVLGVWCYLKNTWQGYLCGTLSLVCSMGFYQAYIDVAMALIVMVLIRRFWNNEDRKETLIHAVKMIAGTASSGVVYFVSYKLVCKIHHVVESDTYNSMSGLGDYTGTSIGQLIVGAYKNFFQFLAEPGTFVTTIMMGMNISDVWQLALKLCLIICLFSILGGIVLLNLYHKTSLGSRILQAVALLGLPLAINFVYVLTKGMQHELMIYSFYFTFVFMIVVLLDCMDKKEIWKKCGGILTIVLVLFIWNNIVYSNQVYFKVDMEDRAGLSMATRIAQDIERTDAYEPGVTKVAIIGSPDKSEYVQQVDYLSEVKFYGNEKTPFSYDMSMRVYFQYYLNVNINMVDIDRFVPEIEEMPIYPANGYIQYVDDVLVVKLSD